MTKISPRTDRVEQSAAPSVPPAMSLFSRSRELTIVAEDSAPHAWALVLLIGLVALVSNVNKAVHIDDAAHLAIAEAILRDPWHPMQQIVFWDQAPEAVSQLNQPHLLFYLLALGLYLGAGLPILHVLVGSFTVLSSFMAYALARQFSLNRSEAVPFVAFIILGPAVLPAQNLMTDVPLLSLWLLGFYCLARMRTHLTAWYGASIAFGLAWLMKYTTLAILPLYLISGFLIQRDFRRGKLHFSLGVILFAIFPLSYAAHNYLDYGSVHFLGRKIAVAQQSSILEIVGLVFARAALFVLTLGQVGLFSIIWLPSLWGKLSTQQRKVWGAQFVGLLALGTGIGQALAHYGPELLNDEGIAHSFLRTLSLMNGIWLIWLLWRAAHSPNWMGKRELKLLLAWILMPTIFVVVLSPFIAVRHVMLVLLPWLILLWRAQPVMPARALNVALVISSVVGSWLAYSDAVLAGAYQSAVPRLAAEGQAISAETGDEPVNYWFVGHWGFQYYAEQQGMQPYIPGAALLKTGDFLLIPEIVHQQKIDASDLKRLTLLRRMELDSNPLSSLRSMTWHLGYYAVWEGLPWTFSLGSLDTLRLYRVGEADFIADEADLPRAPHP